MTKLEQCVRLAAAIDFDGMVTIRMNATDFKTDGFRVEALDSNDGVIASSGDGKPLDEAIAALHANFGKHVAQLREVLAAFESEGR